MPIIGPACLSPRFGLTDEPNTGNKKSRAERNNLRIRTERNYMHESIDLDPKEEEEAIPDTLVDRMDDTGKNIRTAQGSLSKIS